MVQVPRGQGNPSLLSPLCQSTSPRLCKSLISPAAMENSQDDSIITHETVVTTQAEHLAGGLACRTSSTHYTHCTCESLGGARGSAIPRLAAVKEAVLPGRDHLKTEPCNAPH